MNTRHGAQRSRLPLTYPAPVLDTDAPTSDGQIAHKDNGSPEVGQGGPQDNPTASAVQEVAGTQESTGGGFKTSDRVCKNPGFNSRIFE